MVEIENQSLKAAINPVGAELSSLKIKNTEESELIWQRDPVFWPKSAPILFPIVGSLLEDTYILDGKSYHLEKHGLVRTRPWSVRQHGENVAEFKINSDDDTFERYPFHWQLNAVFKLTEKELFVGYRICNRGPEPMLFSIGSHPAFALNFGPGGISNYFIRFVELENHPKCYKPTGKGLSDETFELDWAEGTLQLNENLFDEDALIFKNIGVQHLELGNRASDRRILLSTGGAPDLGIWAKPGAPYVCIEPWYGFDDPESHDQKLENKPGIIELGEHGTFGCYYRIEPNTAWFG